MITAMSYEGLRPTSVAVCRLPVEKTTRILSPSAAPATTWLLVMMRPSVSSTNPEPVALPTWIITVPGSARLATSTVLAVPGAGGSGGAAVVGGRSGTRD